MYEIKKETLKLSFMQYRTRIMTTKNATFTIVELLVVITIIAMLASLLLPALKNAKTCSTQIACLNNQKQILLCHNSYSDDYNDWYVPWTFQAGGGGKWAWGLHNLGYIKINSSDIIGIYMRASGIFRCPGEKFRGNLTSEEFAANPAGGDDHNQFGGTHYGTNGFLNLNVDGFWLTRHKVSAPAMRILQGDTAGGARLMPEHVYVQKDRSTWPRHFEIINVIYTDGHGGKHKPDDLFMNDLSWPTHGGHIMWGWNNP